MHSLPGASIAINLGDLLVFTMWCYA